MQSYIAASLGLMLLLGLTGCATTHNAARPEPRPLGASLPAGRPPTAAGQPGTPFVTAPNPSGRLTLREALTLALSHNPELHVFAWGIRAREASMLQAELLPNPEMVTDLENVAGTRALRGFDAAEITIGLSQRLELGGDRGTRRAVAARRLGLAGWDYEAVRLDVFTETTRAFIAVLAAQERLMLAHSLLAQARRFYESVAARVQAGKVSALEERRAQVVRSTTQMAYERAARDLTVERIRLAATWGRTAPAFEQVAGDLATVETVPPYERLDAFIERNPDVARWRDEMVLRQSEIALEHARRIPDPVLTIGTRRLRDLGETTLSAGIIIPLPLFDRNQGAIREAEYRYQQGEAAQQAVRVQARQMLRVVYERLATAYAEVTTLREAVLPAAQEHFAATEEGYREGKFDLLTVLDAQRTLFETTNQYVDALAAYHTARAEVESLIGTPLSDV